MPRATRASRWPGGSRRNRPCHSAWSSTRANSGSTFRQWLKGIDLAAGDLVWIAESDDTCRPELLERLVPEFVDPEVMLAYCQSAIIGPDGREYAADYLACTEDLSPTRWRYPYCVAGREEVELALSQRNTIPNASAVVFRKPADLDEREDLERLRLGGDWLFYAMRIRRGKIAYVPESLNGHRHHDRTVRNAFERAVALFEEQLAVKARIFESFPVSAGAISCSMARSFVEYIDRTRDLGPRPSMTEHPRLSPADRSAALHLPDQAGRPAGRPHPDRPLGRDPGRGAGQLIHLANDLAARFPVFLCNALPGVLDPLAVEGIDERIVPLEGTLGILPWTWDGDPRIEPDAREAMSSRRAEVVRELIRFHGIDVIQSCGPWAARLLSAARSRAPHPRVRRSGGTRGIPGGQPLADNRGRLVSKGEAESPRTIRRCRLIAHVEYAELVRDYARRITGPSEESRLLESFPWLLGLPCETAPLLEALQLEADDSANYPGSRASRSSATSPSPSRDGSMS